jgi:hypothetical protein
MGLAGGRKGSIGCGSHPHGSPCPAAGGGEKSVVIQCERGALVPSKKVVHGKIFLSLDGYFPGLRNSLYETRQGTARPMNF